MERITGQRLPEPPVDYDSEIIRITNVKYVQSDSTCKCMIGGRVPEQQEVRWVIALWR